MFIPFLKLSLFFFDWGFISLKFDFFFNTILFSIVLFFVCITVFIYSCYYLNGEVYFFYYFSMLLIFIFSIFFLILSNNLFMILMSWDLLGISSFFLVLFYNNWDSCSGSINTVLTNRIGDFFLFMFFSLCFFSSICFLSFSFFSFYFCFFLVLASLTKGAQFPFSGWLPKAISAPTPVSSLVHSSTLVTAGFVLLFNYNFLINSYFIINFLCFVGIFTLFFSGVCALVEEDLKKVVALSTLSQIGFSIITVGLGFSFLGFIHLLSHALFKSCLFIQIGYIIHSSFGQQDGRNYYCVGNFPFFIQLQLLLTLFCLCGLFFFSGFVSKDFILGAFFFNLYSFFFSLFFFISVFLTFCYSFRLWKSFFSTFNSSVYYFCSSILFNFLSLFLVFLSVFFIWWISLNFLAIPSFFLYLDFYVPLFYLFLFFFVFNIMLKSMRFEFSYKFLSDFFPKFLLYFLKNNKYFDTFMNFAFLRFFSFFRFLGYNGLFYFKSLGFNSLVFLVFLFFLILWSLSIIKYIWLPIEGFWDWFLMLDVY